MSFPRVELNESRPRVPSFYVLDIAPRHRRPHSARAERSASARSQAGGASAGMARAARSGDRDRRLRARPVDDGRAAGDQSRRASKAARAILYELSPELQRSLTSRWLRWHRRQWDPADGIVRSTDMTRAALAVAAAGRAAVLADRAAALRRVPVSVPDGGGLSAGAARSAGAAAEDGSADARRSVPSDAGRRAAAAAGRRPVAAVGREPARRAAAADDRDSRGSRSRVRPAQSRDRSRLAGRDRRDDAGPSRSGSRSSRKRAREWTPERFEFAFGLPDMEGRDAHSTPEPALIDGRFKLRGSIDMIERHRKTGFLRVTDHKTGKNRTKARPDRRRRRPRAAAGDLRPGAEGALSGRDRVLGTPVLSARPPAVSSRTRFR